MKKLFLSLLMTFFVVPSTLACTLFGANGIAVKGGGTLVAKNRDWYPGFQDVRLVTPITGYKYYALMTGKNYSFNAGGINEKGLFVAMSTAGSIPKNARKMYPKFHTSDGKRTNDYILNHFSSVLETLESSVQIWSEPVNFILADKDSVAVIEVLPGGLRSITFQQNGSIYQTNHYVHPSAKKYNIKIGKSSLTRYNRIQELFNEHIGLLTWEDFWTMSQDQNAGPTDSIFRVGNKPKGEKTVAELIAKLPPDGKFVLEVRYQPTSDAKQWLKKTITSTDF